MQRTISMRKPVRILLALVCAAILVSQSLAQPAREKPTDRGESPLVTRMMAFDKNKDGKLTREEITDERLLRLFDQADTNKDGIVTKEELTALVIKMLAEQAANGGSRGGFGPGGGPANGPGGPGGRGPGGF